MAITSRGKSWEIINSWWVLISFFWFINAFGIFIPGLKVKKKEWIILGILYFIPTVIFFMILPDKDTGNKPIVSDVVKNIVYSLFFLSWFASIITAFYIRKKYLILLASLRGYDRTDEDIFARRKTTGFKGEKFEYEELLALRNEVVAKIETSDIDGSFIVKDMKSRLDTYITQGGELIKREQKLNKIVSNYNQAEIDKEISDLKKKIVETINIDLMAQYQESVTKYEEHKKSMQEFVEQKEIIRLKIDSIFLTLKQIKLDLIKLEQFGSGEEKQSIFKSFEEKSNELSEYVSILNQNYIEDRQ